ncbi:MAG: hypothetical protein QM644_14220 [Mobilitalea sp.]
MNKRIGYGRYTSDNDSSTQRDVMLMFEDMEGCEVIDKVNILAAFIVEEVHKLLEHSGLDMQAGFEKLISCRIYFTFIMSKSIVLISSITEVLLVKVTRAYISIYLDIPYSIGYNLM